MAWFEIGGRRERSARKGYEWTGKGVGIEPYPQSPVLKPGENRWLTCVRRTASIADSRLSSRALQLHLLRF